MAILTAAIVVVGALCLIDLLLSFGIIRRLREHAELITRISVPDVPVVGLSAGEAPAAFTTVTSEGREVGGATGLRLIAFFSTSCSVCPERVGPFLKYLGEHRVPREEALAVVVGPPGEPPPYLGRLGEAAMTSTEEHDGAVTRAFKVVGYPAFCLLGADGTILATGYDPASLPAPAAV